MIREVFNFQKGQKMLMKVYHRLSAKNGSANGIVLNRLFVQINCKEYHNLISLQIFFSAVELLVILKQVEIQLNAHIVVSLIENHKYFVDQFLFNNFHCVQNKYFYLLQVNLFELSCIL
jgi:hypothetical protein